MWEPQSLLTSRVSTARYGDRFTFVLLWLQKVFKYGTMKMELKVSVLENPCVGREGSE
jgi:hypothetical protein